MVDSFPIALAVGTVLGFLTGLGVGGGSLLLLWLTLVLDMPPETARSINLLFFLPSSLISTLLRRRQGAVDRENAVPAAVSGCMAALVFTFIGSRLDTSLLKTLFGFLLIATGLRELFYKPRQR